MEVHNILPPESASHRDGFNLGLYKQRVSWLYWVAALSGLNTLTLLAGSKTGFSSSLGISSLLVAGTKSSAGLELPGAIVAIALSVGMAMLGYFAMSRQSMVALVFGLAVMCLDTLLLIGIGLLWGRWLPISILIHLWTCGALGLAVKQLMDRGK